MRALAKQPTNTLYILFYTLYRIFYCIFFLYIVYSFLLIPLVCSQTREKKKKKHRKNILVYNIHCEVHTHCEYMHIVNIHVSRIQPSSPSLIRLISSPAVLARSLDRVFYSLDYILRII